MGTDILVKNALIVGISHLRHSGSSAIIIAVFLNNAIFRNDELFSTSKNSIY